MGTLPHAGPLPQLRDARSSLEWTRGKAPGAEVAPSKRRLQQDLRTRITEDTFGRVEWGDGFGGGSGARLPALCRLLGRGLLPAHALPGLRERSARMARERGPGNGLRDHRRAQPES